MLQVVELETIKALNSLNNNLKVVIAGLTSSIPNRVKPAQQMVLQLCGEYVVVSLKTLFIYLNRFFCAQSRWVCWLFIRIIEIVVVEKPDCRNLWRIKN
jgi:hypothetical protein